MEPSYAGIKPREGKWIILYLQIYKHMYCLVLAILFLGIDPRLYMTIGNSHIPIK